MILVYNFEEVAPTIEKVSFTILHSRPLYQLKDNLFYKIVKAF